ncbi:helix-turn-helix domain-containing protein [Microaerobacter geothermalis]|nr:helix-turn-helix domain-containing protein [Microaerobacter geothermalis]
MQFTYQFRLYPTREQEEKMNRTLLLLQRLYNAAKEQREIAYKQFGKSVFYSHQQSELPELKEEFPEYKDIHSQVLQDCLQRVDDAFQRFFRGVAGYPHFKSKDRYLSFTYTQPGAVKKTFAKEGYVYLSKIGFMKINIHRPFDQKNVTQINIKRNADQWVANITVKEEYPDISSSIEKAVGIKVAKAHRKVAQKRNDFLHDQSFRIVRDHDLIAAEQLKIRTGNGRRSKKPPPLSISVGGGSIHRGGIFMLFKLGQIFVTSGVRNAIPEEDISRGLVRFVKGNWGIVCKEDWKMNDEAVCNGGRILGAYLSSNHIKFWIITEGDRSATTILLPDEY